MSDRLLTNDRRGNCSLDKFLFTGAKTFAKGGILTHNLCRTRLNHSPQSVKKSLENLKSVLEHSRAKILYKRLTGLQ